MTRDGEMAARDYLELVLHGVGRESDIGVVQSLQRQARSAIELYAAPEWRATGRAKLADAAERLLRASEPGSDHQLAWARAFASSASGEEHLALLTGLLDGSVEIEGLAVDTELRWALLERLSTTGVAGEASVMDELARDPTAAGEAHAATCRASRPAKEAKAAAWASVVEAETLTNTLQEAVIAGFVQTEQADLLAPYTEKYFAAIKGVFEQRSHEMGQQIIVGLYPTIQVCQDTLDATDAWLDANAPAPALRRMVVECGSGIERALKAQKADRAAARR